MKTIYAQDHGILPNRHITKELHALLSDLCGSLEETELLFAPGTYYIDSADCPACMLYITNTVADSEFSADEVPHQNRAAFHLQNVQNLTINTQNAVFVLNGKLTNFVMQKCENITLKNLEFRHSHPDMHELRVCKKGPFFVDFSIDPDTLFSVENKHLFFYGADYRVRADKNALNAFWIGCIHNSTPEKIERGAHPLRGALHLEQIGERVVRVFFLNTARFHCGDRYYVYDVRRQYAGIFLDRCKNVTLDHVRQRFNYSLALVAQDCENISLFNTEFAPEKGSARRVASAADFIQICMCRGRFTAKNNLFAGAGDDCLNVHGVHFKITEVLGNHLTVRFMHPQTNGFNPLRVGDEIAFIDPKTLLETGRTKILSSAMCNAYDLELVVTDAGCAKVGAVIEDVSACPDVLFSNNTLTRIITRGLLLTTRGHVQIENNHFISTTMSGILLSDDASSWYESGMCRDVTIRGNTFDFCGQTPILIKPENRVHAGGVHKNIRIINNVFQNYRGCCVRAKSTDNVLLKNNRCFSSKIIQQKNCTNVRVVRGPGENSTDL